MGLISLSAMSYVVVLATGIWIGSMLIPWLQNMKICITCKPQYEAGPMVNATPEFTVNVQQTATQAITTTSHSSSPKARARKSGTSGQTRGKAPTLYNYGGQVHVSPHCIAGGGKGPKVLAMIEPCSQCTDSRTLFASEELYRTNKGEKYHTKNCHHIQQKLATGTSSTNCVRTLPICHCVLEHYQQLRQLEDHNDKEH